MKTCIIVILTIVISSCASVPPEFLQSMEKEKEGIRFLNDRHEQAVRDLVDNWYEERLSRLAYIKKIEIDKISFIASYEDSDVEVIMKSQLLTIEDQFNEAVITANQIKLKLIEGYMDNENWGKLIKINAVNVDMAKSLSELNQAQRNFYSALVGDNKLLPSEFINEKTKELLNRF
jgi:hypothetical protein